MLFFMGATSHFAPLFADGDGPEGGTRLTFWLITLVIIIAIEAIALTSPAVGKPQAWHIDNHRNTIIAGFVFAVVLILLFEVLF
jgi:hypothetical protein